MAAGRHSCPGCGDQTSECAWAKWSIPVLFDVQQKSSASHVLNLTFASRAICHRDPIIAMPVLHIHRLSHCCSLPEARVYSGSLLRLCVILGAAWVAFRQLHPLAPIPSPRFHAMCLYVSKWTLDTRSLLVLDPQRYLVSFLSPFSRVYQEEGESIMVEPSTISNFLFSFSYPERVCISSSVRVGGLMNELSNEIF